MSPVIQLINKCVNNTRYATNNNFRGAITYFPIIIIFKRYPPKDLFDM